MTASQLGLRHAISLIFSGSGYTDDRIGNPFVVPAVNRPRENDEHQTDFALAKASFGR
jgi:hypothetical protein